ncbi:MULTISPECIES: hypothetical protein [unclassified Breznakia]|uniref:hypothetical protein n=1 Tax=unclassified Breznakia TaxID=2623764 RepID=UPI002475B306|nr:MULTISPECIES: hypothetical protein [unclassified Breznakia]MDH6366502.1 hypothetical protein [Breznakia sp. PH1-1]MDH6403595.1 hypothetical protein [Breznakia sp. PF1-11]MDH6411304.1 hypothetical protein [Breznakia sp. PFB1-11]MDH6413720.1 hypothetical protein [Breznakia sp. PFB1-14]MDH6415849.1 hypothetical protein [Breznakia sp. PFB1-4]
MNRMKKIKIKFLNYALLVTVVGLLCINVTFVQLSKDNKVLMKQEQYVKIEYDDEQTEKNENNESHIVTRSSGNQFVITIDEEPTGAEYIINSKKVAPLRVSGHVEGKPSSTFTYSWSVNDKPTVDGWKKIEGADQATYTPPVNEVGTKYYRVMLGTMVYDGAFVPYIGLSKAVAIRVHDVAKTPVIEMQPVDSTYIQNEAANALSVKAKAIDDGTLSYQWFVTNSNGNTQGTKITGATNSSYIPSTSEVGTKYYYVVVRNTGFDNTTATVNSVPAKIVVKKVTPTPVITKQPVGAKLAKGETNHKLDVTASVLGGGTLTYTWFSNTKKSIDGATKIHEGKDNYFEVPTTSLGNLYYYVIVSNEQDGQKKSVTSDIVEVNVCEAEIPNITKQPISTAYLEGQNAVKLEVIAENTDDGNLTYQWYKNTKNSTSGGILIDEAIQSTYLPNTTDVGSTYYYVQVSNTWKTSVKTVVSKTAKVDVLAKAQAPSITQQPRNLKFIEDKISGALEVQAKSIDGGALTYQWYQHDHSAGGKGTKILNATQARYVPLTQPLGIKYYSVVITNELNSTVASIESERVSVTLSSKAQKPIIVEQPKEVIYGQGAKADPLQVIATVFDGGTLTYQWYKNTARTTANDVEMIGETMDFITPDTSEIGETYYNVMVSNHLGKGYAAQRSKIVKVEVVPAAQKPIIEVQPKDAIYEMHQQINVLNVDAKVEDGGALSYQWYEFESTDGDKKQPIQGATSKTYKPSIKTIGKKAYSVVVTNTRYGTTKSTESKKVEIQVVEPTEKPTITEQPKSKIYRQNEKSQPLQVVASTKQDGVITYQWYQNKSKDSVGATAIMNATSSSYRPSTNAIGHLYYYVVITNTNHGISREVTSEISDIEVIKPAVVPTITSHPKDACYVEGESAQTLTVKVSKSDAGTLSYQWYQSDVRDTSKATAIEGANQAVYTPSTKDIKTTYYYVKITNTVLDTTAEVTSDAAQIEVVEKAKKPVINKQPENAKFLTNTDVAFLEVNATTTNGTLSYQWYESASPNLTNGKAIAGATKPTYSPNIDKESIRNYYVTVTNTLNGTTASLISNVATITVIDEPKVPTIHQQPQGARYFVNGTAEHLFVDVEISDGGMLNYQWYVSKTKNFDDAILIANATADGYLPKTDEKGIYYYWVKITNTRKGEARHTISDAARIMVVQPAAIPIIHKHPENSTYKQGETPLALHVQASVEDGGKLTYQWYEKTSENLEDNLIDTVTSHTFTPDITSIGSTSYYVVVTNTLDDQISQVTSEVATIKVEQKEELMMEPKEKNPSPSEETNIMTPTSPELGTSGDVDGLIPSTNESSTNVNAAQETKNVEQASTQNNQVENQQGVTKDEVKNTNNDQHHKSKTANTNKDMLTLSDDHKEWNTSAYILMGALLLTLFGLFFLLFILWKRKKDDEENEEQTA